MCMYVYYIQATYAYVYLCALDAPRACHATYVTHPLVTLLYR